MPEPLTSFEQQILDYLVEYVRHNTYQPSIREIGRRFGIKSTKTVSEYLQALADKGWVERDPSRSRGVRLLGVDLGGGTRKIPWFDGIASEGDPLPPESVVDELELDPRLVGEGNLCFLSMHGPSMEGVAIREGDLLLVDRTIPAQLGSGDLVVGRRDGEATVAVYTGGGAPVAEFGGSAPGAIGDTSDMTVVGRVVAVFRRMRSEPLPQVLRQEPAVVGEAV